MANTAAWIAGAGQGLSWGSAFNSSDLAGLVNGSAVLSTIADITNGAALDLYADISVRLAIASATPSQAGLLAVYLAALLDDGVTYGSGDFAAGTQKALTPPFAPIGTIPLQSTNATTLLAGFIQGVVIPPGSFRLLLLNNSGITLSSTAGNNVVKYRTYKLNLNN